MASDQALDELRLQIQQAIREARFWGTMSERGGTAAKRAVALFCCYRALRAVL